MDIPESLYAAVDVLLRRARLEKMKPRDAYELVEGKGLV
jgi:hypothetical protein